MLPKTRRTPAATALVLLERRDHSRAEMDRKLAARGFAAEEIARVLKDLTARGLLDDARYARRLALSCAEKFLGPRRIREKLLQKGIPEDLAREALESAEGALGTKERLGRALRKKLKGRSADALSPVEKKSLAGALYRGGFPWEEIMEALEEAGGLAEE